MSFPSRSQLDEYVASVEAYISATIQSAQPDMHGLSNALNDLWGALSRFGPPEMPPLPSIPGLGTFEVPSPPPPPPPPPRFLCDDSWIAWAKKNRYVVGAGVFIATAGLGYSLGFGASAVAHRRRALKRRSGVSAAGKTVGSDANVRRFVVGEYRYRLGSSAPDIPLKWFSERILPSDFHLSLD